ncbi:MAG: hypothetical protein LBL59_06890 [Xanthomonadaceae bacterium]|jgi:hypothetical protein|nr:hypothetical protein [Xanthomonadaceae bacterium]
MKLQIQNQTLRFRIGESELASLLDGGIVATQTRLPEGSAFAQRIACGAVSEPRLECQAQRWSVTLPETEVRAYAQALPSRNGLKWIVGDDDAAITLVFEVDVHDSLRHREGRGAASQPAGPANGSRRAIGQDRNNT